MDPLVNCEKDSSKKYDPFPPMMDGYMIFMETWVNLKLTSHIGAQNYSQNILILYVLKTTFPVIWD